MTKEIEQLEELVHKRTYRTGEVTQLRRIADTLDDIVAMIKADQEKMQQHIHQNQKANDE
jgi:hypothetical protein